MSAEPSAWHAFVKGKCPQCREGNLFVSGPFNLKKFRQMHPNCPVCHVKYEPEPGFFWGAMYFSYAITVALCVTLGILIFWFVDQPDVVTTSAVIVSVIIVTSPISFRLSRKMMVYITAPYKKFDPDAKNRTATNS